MREIKFRAWDEKEKCWVCGFAIHQNGMFSDWAGCKEVNGKCYADANWEQLKNIPHIKIMQYTGLKDKNGREIYEGDIVRYTKHIYADCSKTKLIKVEKPIIGEFYFAEGLWPGLRFGNGTGMLFLPGYLDSEIEFEVIGNVVDHLHLLKEGV